MADHYFTQQPRAAHDEGRLSFLYKGRELTFTTDAGTFSRDRVDPGSALLLEALEENELTGLCADIGCGWGAIGLSLAAVNPQARFILVDINARAVELARRNAAANGIDNLEILQGDGLEGVHGPLRAAITNPPIRAGKAVVYGLFAQAHARLEEGGALYAVLRVKQGAKSAKAHLEALFGNCQTISRGGGYHVLRAVR